MEEAKRWKKSRSDEVTDRRQSDGKKGRSDGWKSQNDGKKGRSDG